MELESPFGIGKCDEVERPEGAAATKSGINYSMSDTKVTADTMHTARPCSEG
jgi:hypothetical protein